MILGQGYAVKTGATPAGITLFDGSTIEIGPSTDLDLSELDDGRGAATVVHLKQEVGKTISRVKRLADAAARYEIETPAAVAAVRGTTMLVEVAADGTTLVGNIDGSVSVIARGVEVALPPGTHSVVTPGQPPGDPRPGTSPPPDQPVVPPPTAGSPGPTGGSPIASVSGAKVAVTPDRRSVYAGDTITYSYAVVNTGDLPLSGVSVTDDKAGQAAFESGDANGNRIMDPGETWTYSTRYVTKAADVGQLSDSVTATGNASGQTVTASAGTSVEVLGLSVKIASLTAGAVVGQTVVVSGTVNDPSVKEAVLTLNNVPRPISVANGSFTATIELASGTNSITVSVNKPGGVSASDTVILDPAKP
jgi:hypothetical protein